MLPRVLTTIFVAASALSLIYSPAPLVAQTGQSQADMSTPLIEFRFARREPAPEFHQLTDPQSNSVVYVSSKSMVTDADFESVRAHGMPDALILSCRWKPDAGERWAAMLQGKLGAEDDLLALLINGKLISAVRILVSPDSASGRIPPRGGTPVDIRVPVPALERSEIAAAVAKRWPPGGGH